MKIITRRVSEGIQADPRLRIRVMKTTVNMGMNTFSSVHPLGLSTNPDQTIDSKTHIDSHFRFYIFFRGFPLAILAYAAGYENEGVT